MERHRGLEVICRILENQDGGRQAGRQADEAEPMLLHTQIRPNRPPSSILHAMHTHYAEFVRHCQGGQPGTKHIL